MLKLPTRLAVSGTLLAILLMLTAGLVNGASPTIVFDQTIGPPPATAGFDISFVKNDITTYILADRVNSAVDLFDTSKLTFKGGIGSGGFVGNAAVLQRALRLWRPQRGLDRQQQPRLGG